MGILEIGFVLHNLFILIDPPSILRHKGFGGRVAEASADKLSFCHQDPKTQRIQSKKAKEKVVFCFFIAFQERPSLLVKWTCANGTKIMTFLKGGFG